MISRKEFEKEVGIYAKLAELLKPLEGKKVKEVSFIQLTDNCPERGFFESGLRLSFRFEDHKEILGINIMRVVTYPPMAKLKKTKKGLKFVGFTED